MNLFTNISFPNLPTSQELIQQMRLESKDRRLLELLFSKQVSGAEKKAFCDSIVIEEEPMEFNLMLAHLCHRHGFEGIPSEIAPRIRGAARFYLCKNGVQFSSFRMLARSLNRAGIPLLLLKGAAVKAMYDISSSRCLSDIDFAVPENRLQEVVKLAEIHGYEKGDRSYHSIDMKQLGTLGGKVDIHFRLLKTGNCRTLEEELGDGARLIHAFDVDVWVSSPEHLLFQLLENELYNLWTSRETRRRFKWLYDCACVLSKSSEFKWSSVASLAKKYHLYDPIRTLLAMFAEVFPQWLPSPLFEMYFPDQEKIEARSTIDPYTASVFNWVSIGTYRAKLNGDGKKWKSLFLRPLQMVYEYRFLRMDGTVQSFGEFILLHSRTDQYKSVISWFLDKLRRWKMR